MMRRAVSIVGCALLLVAIARPVAAQISCISDLAFELDECGIGRGPNEPAAHCGSMHRGTGGSGWSERQNLEKPEEKLAGGDPDGVGLDRSGVEPVSWGQVKHVLASR